MAFARTNKRPKDIPTGPNEVYAGSGWINWEDFLDSQSHRWRSFKEARAWARSLKSKSTTEWHEFVRTNKKTERHPVQSVYLLCEKGLDELD